MRKHCLMLLTMTAVCACASKSGLPGEDPAAIAAVVADVRVVNGDTTLVVHGAQYELVGWSRADLAAAQAQVERQMRTHRRIFPADTVTPLVITVRRPARARAQDAGPPPVPATSAPIVEFALMDAGAGRDGPQRGGPELPAIQGRTLIRALLSQHASLVLRTPATGALTRGESDDSRLPAWAIDAVALLSIDSTGGDLVSALAAHTETVLPLEIFLTMPRPPFVAMAPPDRGRGGPPDGEGRGGPPGGGRGGPPGGGRGGPPGGGRGGPPGQSRGSTPQMPALQGGALFMAQAAAFGRYLSVRHGSDVLGAIIDAQVGGTPVEEVLAAHRIASLAQLERDWRGWLVDLGNRSRR